MLKILIRTTSFGIAVFLSMLAGIYLSTAEEAFPNGSQYSARFDFERTQLSKAQIISELDIIARTSGLQLAKVVADPNDFYNSRSLYVFGKEAPDEPLKLQWFKHGMHGELRSAQELGDANLSGPYIYSGTPAARAELAHWLESHGVESRTTVRSEVEILRQALVTTGAWLTFLTCLVPLIALVIAWYVLRARPRSIKLLCGAPLGRIVAEDLLSLLRVVALPSLLGVVLAVGVVAFQGKISHLLPFALTSAAFLGVALAAMVLCAVLTSFMTWPSIAAIALRTPPEQRFQRLSELLKAATLVLVTVTLPVVGASIAEATNLSHRNAQWDVLKNHVSVRIATSSEEEFEKRQGQMGDLAVAAAQAGKLTLSYAFKPEAVISMKEGAPRDLGGYDGMVLVDRNYLNVISPLIRSTPTEEAPIGEYGKRILIDELPTALRDHLVESYPLWSRSRTLEGFAENFTPYRYNGHDDFPGLSQTPGTMEHFRNPLIVLVDDPTATFSDGTIGALLSSGNLAFSDAAWVRDYLAGNPLGEVVLSVDRIADAGLYNSQLQNQSAGMKTLSFTLVLLALTMSTAVSALAYAIYKGRRMFVQPLRAGPGPNHLRGDSFGKAHSRE